MSTLEPRDMTGRQRGYSVVKTQLRWNLTSLPCGRSKKVRLRGGTVQDVALHSVPGRTVQNALAAHSRIAEPPPLNGSQSFLVTAESNALLFPYGQGNAQIRPNSVHKQALHSPKNFLDHPMKIGE